MWAQQNTFYMKVGLSPPTSVNQSCHRHVARTAKNNTTYLIVNLNKIKFHSWHIILLALYIDKH